MHNRSSLSYVCILFLITGTVHALPIPKECTEWFVKSNVKKNKECSIRCPTISTGMGTVGCEGYCGELCETTMGNLRQGFDRIRESIEHYYYAYSPAEKAIIKEDPRLALSAYKLSRKAEHICGSLYWESLNGDGSDACRHYVWAILMKNEFGKDVAKRILDAHESLPEQPSSDRTMDDANNTQGLNDAGQMSNEKTDKMILAQFQKGLEIGKIKINRPIEWNVKPKEQK